MNIDFYKEDLCWMYALRNVTSSCTILTTDQRGHTVESNRTHYTDYTVCHYHRPIGNYRRRNRSTSILENSSLVNIRDATDRFSSADFHHRIITQIFSPSLSPSFFLSFSFFAKLDEIDEQRQNVGTGSKTINLRRGISLRISLMSDLIEGKIQTTDKRNLPKVLKLSFANRDPIFFLIMQGIFIIVIALALIWFSFYIHLI